MSVDNNSQRRHRGIVASILAVDGGLCDVEESHDDEHGYYSSYNIWMDGGKRFPCYRNIIQINITTETCTRVILAGTHTDAATGAAPGPLALDVVSRLIYVCRLSLDLRLSWCVSLSLSLSHTGLWFSAHVSPRVLYYFIAYTHYYYYCFLGKRPRDECGARGTTSRRLLRASSRTGPARVNNNKTKRGLVHGNTRARQR